MLLIALGVTLGLALHRRRENLDKQGQFRGLEHDARTVDDVPDVNHTLRSYLTEIATLNVSQIAAFWYAGEIPNERMPLVAADLLECGLESPHLGVVAGILNPKISRADIEEDLDRAFRELGVNAPMSVSAAQLSLGCHLAREVVLGRLEAARGASLMTELFRWDARSPAGKIVTIHRDLIRMVRRNSPEEDAAKVDVVAACREFLANHEDGQLFSTAVLK